MRLRTAVAILLTVGLALAFGFVSTAGPLDQSTMNEAVVIPTDDPGWHDSVRCEGSQSLKKFHLWTAGTARVTGHAVLHYNKIRKSDGKELWRTVTERACTVRYDVREKGTLAPEYYTVER